MKSCQLIEASKGREQFSPIGCEFLYLIFVYEKQASMDDGDDED